MRGFDDKYFEELSGAVEAAEALSTAEIVVAVLPCSGDYRDVDCLVGAVTALVGVLALLYSPWEHPEWAVLVDAALLFALGAWTSSVFPALRRALTRPGRRLAQVRSAAAAAFYEEQVWTTRARTGVLIYVSLLERETRVLADRGITDAVPATDWNRCLHDLRQIAEAPHPARALLAGVREIGGVLAAALPPSEDNPDELPNRPRR
jgi:putative membrane protein